MQILMFKNGDDNAAAAAAADDDGIISMLSVIIYIYMITCVYTSRAIAYLMFQHKEPLRIYKL